MVELLYNKDAHVFYNKIKEDIKNPFFILLLFGSHVRGKQRKNSDLDLLLISDNDEITKSVRFSSWTKQLLPHSVIVIISIY